jgi:hypothetical protein
VTNYWAVSYNPNAPRPCVGRMAAPKPGLLLCRWCFLQARPPPLTGGRVHSGRAQSTDANGGARGAPARAPDAFESPFDGGRRRTVVRSGRAMRRGSMSRVENRVGRCLWNQGKRGASGQRKMELADEKA